MDTIKIKQCYIILHYKTIEETQKSVKSILDNLGTNTYRIIVVDNGSNDNSFKKLVNKYKDNSKIIIIQTDSNLGFAKGNNYGISYAKNNFSPQFYIVMNSDIYLNTKNFGVKINEIYNETNFSVLGPQIILNDGDMDSNPMRDKLITKNEINALLFKKYVNLIITVLRLDNFKKKIQEIIKKIIKKEKKEYTGSSALISADNVQLHGSCLIFSDQYIEKYSGFYPHTFLFFEEYFLFENIIKNNLTSLYDTRIKVIHDEDSSINKTHKTDYKKEKFVYYNEIKSLKKLKKYKINKN